MKDIKVASVCMHSETGEWEKNLKKVVGFVQDAAEDGADIICFPELAISGYFLENPAAVYSRETYLGVLESVVELARSYKVILLAGTIEIGEGEKPHISQIVAGPEGLMGVYRKTHLSPKEKGLYEPGQGIGVFTQGVICFGVQLCYESHFPEITTVMALRGAEVVFIPHASPRGRPQVKIDSWLRHLPGRAFDNALYIVACNQVGKTRAELSFPGGAVVVGPAGRVVARYDKMGEGILMTDLKEEEVRKMRGHRMRYFLPNRRPELYGEIADPNKILLR